MKRLFIGFPVKSESAFQLTENWRNQLVLKGNVLKWSKPENWHVTLFFFGNTPETAIPLLQNLIEKSFHSAQAFHTELSGVGTFPNLHRPKVLWLGLNDISPLMPSYSILAELLEKQGFDCGNKPLKPHLTLARIKNSPHLSDFSAWLEKHSQSSFGTIAVGRIILYESISTSEGPVYQPLFVHELPA